MSCRVTLPNGKLLILKNLPEHWAIGDLLSDLIQRGHLNSSEANMFTPDEINSPIPAILELSPNKIQQNESIANRGLRPHLNQPAETTVITSSSSGRLKKKKQNSQTQHKTPSASGMLKKNPPLIKVSQQPPPAKISQQPQPVITPPKKIPKPRGDIFNSKVYTLQLTCSKTNNSWYATLLGLTVPSQSAKQANNKQNTTPSSNYGTIHLALDDSGSMRSGNGVQELQNGVYDFLQNRPDSDLINMETFNQSATSRGGPSSVKSAVSGIKAAGGTPMTACLNRLSAAKNDVVILFSDGGPNGRVQTEKAATALKQKGVRIITIGCGSVDVHYMKSLASSHSDYHHANNPTQILQAFQQVASSLAQDSSILTTKAGSTTGASRAEQISAVKGIPSIAGDSNYGNTSKLAANESFEVIEQFECAHCSNTTRTCCPSCDEALCGGGLVSKGKADPEMDCPNCKKHFSVQKVAKLSMNVNQNLGKGKPKGR